MRVLFKRNVSITACFDFQSNGAARQREPFIFDPRALGTMGQRYIRAGPTVDIARSGGLNRVCIRGRK